MLTPFKPEELREISVSLEDYHVVFYTFFEMAQVYYCDTEVSTAAVRFHSWSLKPDLLINKVFWEGLTHRERLFVICHECLHVILLHDQRLGYNVEGATARLINIAQDITINEMIVDLFHFRRDDLREWKRFCWIETCFAVPQMVKRDQTFIYYLELLVKEKNPNLPDLLDEHGGEPGGTAAGAPGEPRDSNDMSPEAKDNMQAVAERLAEELSPEELEDLLNAGGGGLAGSQMDSVQSVLVNKRQKSKIQFTKLIRHLKRTRIKPSEGDHESWAAEDRRYSDIMKRNKVSIPGHRAVTKASKDKLLTVLFMDVSGSVIDELPTFQKIYAAFDHDRETFEIRCFAFATSVVEIVPDTPLHAGIGTSFHILENKLQELKEEYGKYPDAVIIVTDGEGNTVKPEAPSRWVWMLTPHAQRIYIPRDSKTFNIKDVVF